MQCPTRGRPATKHVQQRGTHLGHRQAPRTSRGPRHNQDDDGAKPADRRGHQQRAHRRTGERRAQGSAKPDRGLPSFDGRQGVCRRGRQDDLRGGAAGIGRLIRRVGRRLRRRDIRGVQEAERAAITSGALGLSFGEDGTS